MLNPQDISILEEIVNLNGKCMDSERCLKCPFRAVCLPEFLNPVPPSPEQRASIALDILTHHSLIDDELRVEEYKWKQQ